MIHKIEGGELTNGWHHWSPPGRSVQRTNLLLHEVALFPLEHEQMLSLGLSGGMNSRTILALLLGNGRSGWQVHSIGDRDNSDVAGAKLISERLKIPIQILYYQLEGTDTVDSIMNSPKAYSLLSEMTDSLFGYKRLSLFSDLRERGYWTTDGGYGELLSRSYVNRFVFMGRMTVARNGPTAVLKFFSRPRSPIFNPDVEGNYEGKPHTILKQHLKQCPGPFWNEILAIGSTFSTSDIVSGTSEEQAGIIRRLHSELHAFRSLEADFFLPGASFAMKAKQ